MSELTQKTIFLALVTILIILFMTRCCNTFIKCNENYSPFKNTGGITSEYSGYNYLDEYNDQQYYKFNPWIYPTPTSYIRLLYGEERKNAKYLEDMRKKMIKKMNHTNY